MLHLQIIALKRKVIYKWYTWHHHFWVSIQLLVFRGMFCLHTLGRPKSTNVFGRSCSCYVTWRKKWAAWSQVTFGESLWDLMVTWLGFCLVRWAKLDDFTHTLVCGDTGVTGVGEESWMFESCFSFPKWTQHVIWVVLQVVRLMEEILNIQLGCIKTCESWDKLQLVNAGFLNHQQYVSCINLTKYNSSKATSGDI